MRYFPFAVLLLFTVHLDVCVEAESSDFDDAGRLLPLVVAGDRLYCGFQDLQRVLEQTQPRWERSK